MRRHFSVRSSLLSFLAISAFGCSSPDDVAEEGSAVTDQAASTYRVEGALSEAAELATLEDGRFAIRLYRVEGDSYAERTLDQLENGAGKVIALPPAEAPKPATFADLPKGATPTEDESGRHVAVGTLGTAFGSAIVETTGNGPGVLARIEQAVRTAEGVTLVATLVSISDVVKETPATRGRPTEGRTTDFAIDFSGKDLFANDNLAVRIKSGSVKASVWSTASMDIRDGGIDSIYFAVEGTLDGKLVVEASAKGSFDKSFSRTLFEQYTPLPTTFAGPVPIVSTVRTTVVAACRVRAAGDAHIVAGLSAREELGVTASYARDEWNVKGDVTSPEVSRVGPEISAKASASVDCSITPKFNLLFYSLVGPYVSVTPRATVAIVGETGEPLHWNVEADLSAKMGMDTTVKIPGFPKLESAIKKGVHAADKTVYSKTWPLAEGTIE